MHAHTVAESAIGEALVFKITFDKGTLSCTCSCRILDVEPILDAALML